MNQLDRHHLFRTSLPVAVLGVLALPLFGADLDKDQTTVANSDQKALGRAAVTHPGASGKTRLFIFSGQSNMVGLKPNMTVMPLIRLAFPDDELISVTVAEGGKPIRLWYKPWKDANGKDSGMPQGELYDRLLAEVQVAIRGKTLHSSMFLWMQGEADGRAANTSAVYEKSQIALIQQLDKRFAEKAIELRQPASAQHGKQ